MQIYMRRYGAVDAAAGEDEAIFGFPIPAESTLNFMKGEFHFLPSIAVDILDVVLYGLECWILKSDSFADFATINNLWNTMVPKDDGVVELDDDFTLDVDNVFEPGLVNPAQIFDQELLGPERIYQTQKMHSIATTQFGFKPGSPDTFFPSSLERANIKKKYRAIDDSAAVWGISSPALDALTSEASILGGVALEVDGFYIMKYMSDFIDKAMVDLVGTGLTETGAESPFEDIMDFTLELLENAGVNNSTGDFTPITWTVAGKMTAGVRVPGTRTQTTIGPDAQA